MQAIISFALRQRVLVLLLAIGFLIVGGFAFQRLNIEAYPDPVPPMVDIVTQIDGMSAEEVERYITIPIEIQTSGLPNVRYVRSISLFGLSDVKLQFTFDYTYEQAVQQVLNRLASLPPLPSNAQPQISPVSPIGEIYRYRLVGPPGMDVRELKTAQDWILQRRFRAVPGVIDVTGWGGKTKTYEVQIDFDKLVAYGLTLPQVLQALNNANINVGGNTVDIGIQSAVVRGVGLIRNIQDIENTMIAQTGGSPVLVRDIARVEMGNQPRLGIAGMNDDDDIVQGIVLMRRGEKSMPTILNVLAAVDKINSSGILPAGVRIERIYDRKELIDLTTRTVLHNMVVGIALVFLIQWLFLGDLRSALIVSMTIPFSLAFAVVIMVLRGDSANLLSVGAVDFGLIVDSTVILVENIFRRLSHSEAMLDDPPSPWRKLKTIYEAAGEVSRSIFFSGAIVIAAFVPLFTLSGVEAHIFGPMAHTYAYALVGGLLATFIVSPAMSALLLPDRVREKETILVRALDKVFRPLSSATLRHGKITMIAAAVILVAAGITARGLGLEFLPKLEEGNLWIRASMPATISLAEGNIYVNRIRRMVAESPEIVSVVSQHGRPDDGTDATGFFNAEFFAPLKPESQWRKGLDKDALTSEILARLTAAFPGIEFNFSQYLQDNVSEAVSGVKGENSVKLYGNDLQALTTTAEKIKATLAVPGVKDLSIFASLGQPTIRIDVRRDWAARYGLAPGDINAAVRTAVGGQSAGDLFEGDSDRHFPIVVRLAPRFRQSAEAIGNLTIGVAGANGQIVQAPLSEVADIRLVSGASYIYREQQERYLPIKFSVRDRDLGSTILDAQARVRQQIVLPGEMRIEWVGEFANLTEAVARLQVVVPATLVIIALLLFLNFGSLAQATLAISVIPMAVIGGIFALALTRTPFSISAAMGFIALFGISVMEGVILLSAFNDNMAAGMKRSDAVRRSAETRLRPVMMTCVAACVGLLPAAISTGIGSQVQRPLAIVVVGGILLAPILILVVLPVMIDRLPMRWIIRKAPVEERAVLPAG